MDFKHIDLSYRGVLCFPGLFSSDRIANLCSSASKLQLSVTLQVQLNMRLRTKEQAWKPCAYIQYNTINGIKCPTCIDGAVGSTPTYTPTRFSVNNRSRSSRSLGYCYTTKCSSYIGYAMANLPYDLIDISPLLQHGQHAFFRPSLDLRGLTSPFYLCFQGSLDVILGDGSSLDC